MIEFMNLVTTMSPNFGSGMISRFSALWRRDMIPLVSRSVRPPDLEVVDVAYFGRFAPYFERRCLRFLTPCVSSTPRRMW